MLNDIFISIFSDDDKASALFDVSEMICTSPYDAAETFMAGDSYRRRLLLRASYKLQLSLSIGSICIRAVMKCLLSLGMIN